MLSALFLGAVGFGSIPLASGTYVMSNGEQQFGGVFIIAYFFSELDPGVVGLALAYTISLAGMFQFCVRQSAEVENLVSSIKTYPLDVCCKLYIYNLSLRF